MPNFDLRMAESGRGVLRPLSPGVIESVRRVWVQGILSGTRYSLARALAAVVGVRASNWTRLEVVGWIL